MNNTNFREMSKYLRMKLQIVVTEEMSSDPAVRFAYSESLNARMLECLNDINAVRPGVRDEFDQIKAMACLFGDGHMDKTPSHLVEAAKFLANHNVSEIDDMHIGVTIEHRQFWLPPRIRSFTITIGGAIATFTDEENAAK